MITIKAHSLSDFVARYLPAQRPRHGIEATVLHHTYRPTASDYQGLTTIKQIQAYHRHNRGWRDIGANAYAAPDGRIFNARPLSYSNYAHAYISKDWDDVPEDLRRLAHPDRNFLNHCGFGIETIGDFDARGIDPVPPALAAALDLAAAVHRQYELPPERLFFHRDAAYKTCPGRNIDRDWARRQIAQRLQADGTELEIRLLPDGVPVDCRPALSDGVTRCDLRPLAETLGYTVIADTMADDGVIYLRRSGRP
ncbi:MAG: peptidoglycan recognition family protein [Armatimonadota bacterium]